MILWPTKLVDKHERLFLRCQGFGLSGMIIRLSILIS